MTQNTGCVLRKTYFIDIDGTLLEHIEDFENVYQYSVLKALPGAKEKTVQWHCEGHMIILTTARAESLRDITETQLRNAGVVYDLLLMGLGSGKRVLINDIKDRYSFNKADAHNIIRNIDGIINVE
jgi:uncharacterized HAD superfamily protein